MNIEIYLLNDFGNKHSLVIKFTILCNFTKEKFLLNTTNVTLGLFSDYLYLKIHDKKGSEEI